VCYYYSSFEMFSQDHNVLVYFLENHKYYWVHMILLEIELLYHHYEIDYYLYQHWV